MNRISTAFLNCSYQTSLSKCQDIEVLTDEKFRCFYFLTWLACSLAVNGRLKTCKRLCCFHFKFIPVLSAGFYSFTNLPQHGTDSCPVPALPTRRKLLGSAFCQQSCLYEHYRTHHTSISGINAEQALTQNCAQELRTGQHVHLCLERYSRSQINSLGQQHLHPKQLFARWIAVLAQCVPLALYLTEGFLLFLTSPLLSCLLS